MWRGAALQQEAKEIYSKWSPYVLWAAILILLLRSCGGGGETTHDDTSVSDTAKARGEVDIVVYLTATQGDKEAAAAIYGSLVADTDETHLFPFPGKRIRAQSSEKPVKLKDDPETWLVTTDIFTGADQETWQLQLVHAGGWSPASLPGQMPSPGPAVGAATKATNQVPEKSPLGAAVKSFFTAWFTNSNDLPRIADASIPRFQTPTATDATNVKVLSMLTDNVPQDVSGEAVVVVVVDGTTTTTTRRGYTVKMKADGGLWKAASVTASPPLTTSGGGGK